MDLMCIDYSGKSYEIHLVGSTSSLNNFEKLVEDLLVYCRKPKTFYRLIISYAAKENLGDEKINFLEIIIRDNNKRFDQINRK